MSVLDSSSLYPWQQDLWKQIVNSPDRLPHAISLSGPEGSGKFDFATVLAKALLCDVKLQGPCNQCRNCKLFNASTHPDFHLISSESRLSIMDKTLTAYAERFLDAESARSKRKTIRDSIVISQIRAIIELAYLKPHLSDNKVFVLDPAASMTIEASNSLLKILEEPASRTYLILISSIEQSLLPTIASRCQNMSLSNIDSEVAKQWLKQQGVSEDDIQAIQLSDIAPLVGLRLIKDDKLKLSGSYIQRVIKLLQRGSEADVLTLAQEGQELGEKQCLNALQLLVFRLIQQSLISGQKSKATTPELSNFDAQLDTKKLFSAYDHIVYLRQQSRSAGLDKKFMLEDALFEIERSVR